MVIVDIPLELSLEGEVLGLLEGGLDAVGEGMQGTGIWPSVLKSLDELIEVGDLARIVDTTTLVVEAGGEVYLYPSALVAEDTREADGVVARVIEDILCSAVVTALGVHAV